ncbi:MAG: gamma-glutamyltransferase [Steroidobacteraceae bacterium]
MALALAIAAFSAMAGASASARVRTLATITHAPAVTREALSKAKPVIARHAMVVSAQHLAAKATPSSAILGDLGATEGNHTTHYSVADRYGNAVSVTYTYYRMNVQQAVNAPRMHQQWYPQEIWIEDGMLSSESQRKLEQMGYRFRTIHAMGADEAILINPKTGVLEGANDRRRPAGLAAGY